MEAQTARCFRIPYLWLLCRLTWLQEGIVSVAVAAAAVGSALGGALADAFGRRLMACLLIYPDLGVPSS